MRMGKIARHSQTLLICDSYGEPSTGYYAATVYGGGVRHASDRHSGGANVLFFDGHVDWYTKEYLHSYGWGSANWAGSLWDRD
ncbi:MAG: hypothetical protein DDT33_01705 [Firmicutes bacterium]|nr:hypothetical protein [Bacillota bacterium]